MVVKKTKRNIRNRRKTKRKQRGGDLYEVTRFEDGGVNLFNIMKKMPEHESKEYINHGLTQDNIKIIPFFSRKAKIDKLLPGMDDRGVKLFNLFSGKKNDAITTKRKVMYSHRTEDKLLFELNQLFLTQINLEDDFTKEIIRALTKKDLYKKVWALRFLVYLYLGKEGTEPDDKDINTLIEEQKNNPAILDNPFFDPALSVDSIPEQSNGKPYYQAFFNDIKQVFGLDPNVLKISTNIYSNGLLQKCYDDISSEDIKSIMNKLSANDRKKYSLIYSENDRDTYDNIRYLLINTSIISNRMTGKMDAEALITPGVREADRLNVIATQEEKARQDALLAILAVMARPQPVR
jgi:hypothetical protein